MVKIFSLECASGVHVTLTADREPGQRMAQPLLFQGLRSEQAEREYIIWRNEITAQFYQASWSAFIVDAASGSHRKGPV